MAGVDLSGQVAVVTGGSRGLGREMCRAFAAAGADVVVASRKLHPCEELAAELTETYGTKSIGLACHVGDWAAIDDFVRRVHEVFPAVHVLVNNAGMSPVYDTESSVTEALFDKVLAVNLKGPFRLTALIGERMVADGVPGSIINVSSMAAVNPHGPSTPYAVAKAGLNTMTVAYSRRLGPTVRVNAIMAGPFATDIAQHWDMSVVEKQVARHSLQRVGRPEEIVGTALYLASDASSFTTGAVIPVNGGEV
jgi:NAD(P)-dependent dehydrogenase (short-subunit alcohol dehydrogenase family)